MTERDLVVGVGTFYHVSVVESSLLAELLAPWSGGRKAHGRTYLTWKPKLGLDLGHQNSYFQ